MNLFIHDSSNRFLSTNLKYLNILKHFWSHGSYILKCFHLKPKGTPRTQKNLMEGKKLGNNIHQLSVLVIHELVRHWRIDSPIKVKELKYTLSHQVYAIILREWKYNFTDQKFTGK